MDVNKCLAQREFLKDYERDTVDSTQTDQAKGVPAPPTEVSEPKGLTRYFLEPVEDFSKALTQTDFLQVIEARRTRRKFTEEAITLSQLSALLWATAGYREPVRKKMRHTPSAGNRQGIETYAVIMDSDHIPAGVYRYVPSEHALDLISDNTSELRERSQAAARDQIFAGTCGVNIIFAAVPYRGEWRYMHTYPRVLLMDVGHMCQNLYLATTALGLGCCAIAAIDQDLADRLIGADGVDQFAIYMCPVGTVEG